MKIVEATILIPLTIIITVSIIGLMMNYYSELDKQIGEHGKVRSEIYEKGNIW